MADRQANIWLRLKNARGVGSSLRRLGGGFVGLGKRAVRSIAGIGRSLLSLKALILGGLVYGALRLARGAFNMFTGAASDAEETAAKFGTVFDRLTKPAEKWAAATAKATGRANTHIKGWMSTLQDTFVPLGMTEDAAFGMTQQIVALGIDLASFNKMDTTESINALTAALVGNHETVRRFGIIIDEARLKEEAYASGIAKTGAKLTAMQKVQARANLIMKGSTRAMGDAVRTSKSFANINVRLASTWLSLKERVGKFIIESKGVSRIYAKISEAVESAIGWFEKNETVVQRLADKGFAFLATKVEAAYDSIQRVAKDGSLLTWLDDQVLGIRKLIVWVRKGTLALKELAGGGLFDIIDMPRQTQRLKKMKEDERKLRKYIKTGEGEVPLESGEVRWFGRQPGREEAQEKLDRLMTRQSIVEGRIHKMGKRGREWESIGAEEKEIERLEATQPDRIKRTVADMTKALTPDTIERTITIEVIVKAGEDVAQKVGKEIADWWDGEVEDAKRRARRELADDWTKGRAVAIALRQAD